MGMQRTALQARALTVIDKLRLHLPDTAFARRHRKRPADFTRERVLTFPVLMLLLLQKSLKSLQAHVHEFFWQWPGPAVSAGALTHARGKLCASAFGELNALVLQTVYQDAAHAPLVQRWRGHRLLGVDSSLVRLPEHASLRRSFGVVECSNHHGAAGSYPEGRVSVLYDLGNQLALDAVLVGSRTAETELAAGHLPHVQKDDVVITDRGYSGYRWFIQVRAAGAHFVARCSRGSFAAVQALFARDEAGVSQVVTLAAPRELRTRCQEEHWPLALIVRLVTVRLPGGELEVLATSLLEEARYPSAELAGVYWRRWGQETFYARLKGRLDLEHFSGQTPEAVAQDFAALVLLSNVESVVIGPAQEQLAAVSARREQAVQVNRAVSLHALKVRLIELLASSVPTEQVLAELTEWFVRSPVSVRPGRAVPRRRPSPLRSYHYQRRVRKFVF